MVDASDRQIFASNKYKSSSQQILHILAKRGDTNFDDGVLRPSQLGDFSEVKQGILKTIGIDLSMRDADFNLNYLLNKRKGRTRNPDHYKAFKT